MPAGHARPSSRPLCSSPWQGSLIDERVLRAAGVAECESVLIGNLDSTTGVREAQLAWGMWMGTVLYRSVVPCLPGHGSHWINAVLGLSVRPRPTGHKDDDALLVASLLLIKDIRETCESILQPLRIVALAGFRDTQVVGHCTSVSHHACINPLRPPPPPPPPLFLGLFLSPHPSCGYCIPPVSV